MPLISAIIPVYNVAPFAGRCARALMEQTLQEVEFIFVDDASPDGSMDIIRTVVAEYPERNVKFLRHEVNKGLPAARNTGMEAATGEYIWHCDSDDWPEPNMLEELYNAAVAAQADYAYCDFYMDFGDARKYMETPSYTDPGQMIKQGFLSGAMKYNVWNKLVKNSLYRTKHLIRFPEGHSMGEDMTMIPLAMLATRTVRVPKALYNYSKSNGNAFTNTVPARHLTDIHYNAARTIAYLDGWKVQDKDRYMAWFKLNIKLPFLLTGHRSDYKTWCTWYPEANAYIASNSYLPRRTRLVQQWATQGLWPLVWLYAFAINKIYYGMLLRLEK